MSDSTGSLRVLIVDGSRDFQAVARRWLEVHPEVRLVRCAVSAQEAVDAALAKEADLLLIDAALPGTGGFELTRRIKALPDPPLVVLLVLFDYATVRKEAERAGADACIDKSALTQRLSPMLHDFAARARTGATPDERS